MSHELNTRIGNTPHVDVFDQAKLLTWLGDSRGGPTTIAKVRLICKKVLEAARTEGRPLINQWCALYNQVVTVLNQDTSLWKSDFITALLEHHIDLEAGFEKIEDILPDLQWSDGDRPAVPGRVEQLPYLSGLLRARNLSPQGSAVFTRFMPD